MQDRGRSLAGGEIDRRKRKSRRAPAVSCPKVGSVALALQFAVGDDPCRSIRAGAVDADQLALVVVESDDAKLPVAGLGLDLGREPRRDALAPGLLRNAVKGVNTSAEAGADQAVDGRGGAIADQIAASSGNIGFQTGRQQA